MKRYWNTGVLGALTALAVALTAIFFASQFGSPWARAAVCQEPSAVEHVLAQGRAVKVVDIAGPKAKSVLAKMSKIFDEPIVGTRVIAFYPVRGLVLVAVFRNGCLVGHARFRKGQFHLNWPGLWTEPGI